MGRDAGADVFVWLYRRKSRDAAKVERQVGACDVWDLQGRYSGFETQPLHWESRICSIVIHRCAATRLPRDSSCTIAKVRGSARTDVIHHADASFQ